MKEVILNCKSKKIYKTVIKLKYKSKYNIQNLVCKINNKKSKEDIYSFKIKKIKEQLITCKSKLNFNSSVLKFKLKHNVLPYKIKEYGITNEVIIKDIDTFFDIAKHYIELFSYNNQIMIIDYEDSAFILLKTYENKIESIQQFREFNINKIFTKELIFKIQYK